MKKAKKALHRRLKRPTKVKKYRDDKWFDWSKATPGWYAHMSYGAGKRKVMYDECLRLPMGNGQTAIKNVETGYVNVVDEKYTYSTKIAALKALEDDHQRYVNAAVKSLDHMTKDLEIVQKEVWKVQHQGC